MLASSQGVQIVQHCLHVVAALVVKRHVIQLLRRPSPEPPAVAGAWCRCCAALVISPVPKLFFAGARASAEDWA